MKIVRMKNIIKKLLYYLGYYNIRFTINYGRRKEDVFLVLIYHDVIARQGKSDRKSILRPYLYPDVDQLETHFKVLKKEFKIFTVEQIVASLKENGNLPEEPCVAVTFDDGYSSFYHLVWPLLQRYEIPATVFLITDWINGKMIPWWERLTAMVELSPTSYIAYQKLKLFWEENVPSEIRSSSQILSKLPILFDSVENYLKELDESHREAALEELGKICASGSTISSSIPDPMTWKQAQEVMQGGVRIGSHSCSHLNMARASFEQIRNETIKSKEEIEAQIGEKVEGFAYPYGFLHKDFDNLRAILKDAGYKYACSATLGINQTSTGVFQLRRMTLPNSKSKALIRRDLLIDFIS